MVLMQQLMGHCDDPLAKHSHCAMGWRGLSGRGAPRTSTLLSNMRAAWQPGESTRVVLERPLAGNARAIAGLTPASMSTAASTTRKRSRSPAELAMGLMFAMPMSRLHDTRCKVSGLEAILGTAGTCSRLPPL